MNAKKRNADKKVHTRPDLHKPPVLTHMIEVAYCRAV